MLLLKEKRVIHSRHSRHAQHAEYVRLVPPFPSSGCIGSRPHCLFGGACWAWRCADPRELAVQGSNPLPSCSSPQQRTWSSLGDSASATSRTLLASYLRCQLSQPSCSELGAKRHSVPLGFGAAELALLSPECSGECWLATWKRGRGGGSARLFAGHRLSAARRRAAVTREPPAAALLHSYRRLAIDVDPLCATHPGRLGAPVPKPAAARAMHLPAEMSAEQAAHQQAVLRSPVLPQQPPVQPPLSLPPVVLPLLRPHRQQRQQQTAPPPGGKQPRQCRVPGCNQALSTTYCQVRVGELGTLLAPRGRHWLAAAPALLAFACCHCQWWHAHERGPLHCARATVAAPEVETLLTLISWAQLLPLPPMQRHRICAAHCRADSFAMEADGALWRFCQQVLPLSGIGAPWL